MTTSREAWIRNYVDGGFVDPDPQRSFENLDPATGQPVALVHEADSA
ncbi:MAG: hypothetical protein H5T78_05205, partial [Nocardia sp.]|nr:hypothetical protein [Nocardia sp.]